MKHQPPLPATHDPSSEPLQIKLAHSAHEGRLAKQALGKEHKLDAGHQAGDRMSQLLYQKGQLAAVLVGCAAAWHLKDRNTISGWDAVTRSQRLKLVVPLRRFLVLEEAPSPIWPVSAWG